MSILIKGLFGKDMPMPQEGFVDIRIHFKSGKLKCVTMPTGEDPFYATFDVEKVPPHGRLIDADKLNTYDLSPVNGFCVMGVTEEDIGLADTVIEREDHELMR